MIQKVNKNGRYSYEKKNLNLSLTHIILLLTVQQALILFPFFRPGLKVHRWNDDFVVFNEWAIASTPYNFIPTSVDSWLANTRSRAYMPQFLVIAYKILGQNQQLFLLTLIICWFIALICLAFLLTKIFPTPAALIVTLLVGSSPYRNDFFPYMQGSGYTVVFLLFSIAACLVYFSLQTKEMKSHNIFLFSALLTLYISFYFYEIAIITTAFFSIIFLYFRKNCKILLSRKRTYFEASTFLLLGAMHTLIILTAPNQMWNRSKISDLNFVNLTHYLFNFTGNYFEVLINPFVWVFSRHLLYTQIPSLIQNDLFVLTLFIFFFLLVYTSIRFAKLARQSAHKTRVSRIDHRFKHNKVLEQKFWGFDTVHIFLASIFLIVSPYIGFLTFGGGFPVRLSVLAIPGFAIIIGLTFIFFDSRIVSVKNRIKLFSFYLFIPIVLSVFASYQSQGISSVSSYDNRLESDLLAKLPNSEEIDFPIILHIATPACAESNFWGQAYGGSIWGANNGQLNLANALRLLNKKDPDLSRVLYVPISVKLPPELSKIASDYCLAGKMITIPRHLLPPLPKFSDAYLNNLQYYIDPNLDLIEIKPS